MYRSPTSFAGLNRLILRDLNSGASSSAFSLYSRDDITSYLQNPQSNEKQIRDAFATDLPDCTKIIIAQRISSVEHADKIIVMENGMISAFGTHDELLKASSIYQEVYEQQVNGGEDNE